MSSQENAVDQEFMRPLRLQYLRDLTEREKLLGNFQKKMADEKLDEREAEELRALAHKLSGTGATYGFPQISDRASALEDLLISQKPPAKDILSNTDEGGLSKNESNALLEPEMSVPTKLISLQLEQLLEACAAAHDQEPIRS